VPKPPVVRPQPEVADTSDKLSSLRLKILDKMDNITELKNQLRNDYVPIGLCSDLEQCVRETEVSNSWLIIVASIKSSVYVLTVTVYITVTCDAI
jgi:hypothetical protein